MKELLKAINIVSNILFEQHAREIKQICQIYIYIYIYPNMKAFVTSYWFLKPYQDLVFNSDQVLQGQRILFLHDVYSFWFIVRNMSVINA